MAGKTRTRKTTDEDVEATADTPARDDEPTTVSTASPVGNHPRDTQHPSLGDDGSVELEVRERTVDIDTASGEEQER